MKFTLFIIVLGAAGFAAGFFSRDQPGGPEPGLAKTASARLGTDLRSGDAARVLETLQGLATEDPGAFFKELNRCPSLEGIHEMVDTAARGLADKDPAEVAPLLNRITHVHLRTRAWREYLLPRRSMGEKIGIARLARSSVGNLINSAVIGPGLESDPEGALNSLRDAGEIAGYREALAKLAASQPAQVVASLKEDLESGWLKPGDCQTVLEAMARNEPNREVLEAIASMVKDYGWGEGLYAGRIFFQALGSGNPAEVLDVVVGLPAVQKNFALSQIPLAGFENPALAARVINSMDSTALQIAALKEWKQSEGVPGRIDAVAALIASGKTRGQWQAVIDARDP
ncbi:hypothetical protein [Luteolibacter sp. Populi]|uniref:hypothetical protein n=1 Tax=Luteolibacter sp. Populi TaxID=3230487 RepID=UPI003466715B